MAAVGAGTVASGSLPYAHPAAAAYGLAAGQQLAAAAAREQELVYRELVSRMQYNADPVIAQQASSSTVKFIFS